MNDQRVDGIVRLMVGDKLRFGCCSTIYEITSSGKNSHEVLEPFSLQVIKSLLQVLNQ